MKMANLNSGQFDFGGDINAKLCSPCRLSKSEVHYVTKKICGIDAAHTCRMIQKKCIAEGLSCGLVIL